MSPFHTTRALPEGATGADLRADARQVLTTPPKTLPHQNPHRLPSTEARHQ